MIGVKRSTMHALREARLNGNATLIMLPSMTRIDIRCAAGFYHHVDYQCHTRADWEALGRIANGNPRNATWPAYPAVLEFTVGNTTHRFAVAVFTFNHSIRVASNAYDIVSPIVTRATERDANGRWVPGHHMCFHTFDSVRLRPGGDNNQFNRGHKMVINAERLADTTLAQNTQAAQSAQQFIRGYSVQVIASRAQDCTQNVLARLEELGHHNAYSFNGNGWYRVRVGVFPTRENAVSMRDRLQILGFSDAFVVAY